MLEVQALDPRGKATTQEILTDFGKRFSFAKVPQTLSEMDFSKGVVLSSGRMDDVAIESITAFPNGLIIDTRSSTENAERVLDHILGFVEEAFGAVVRPNRKHFVSQIVFRSRLQLSLLNPALRGIADQITRHVSEGLRHDIVFEPTAILFNTDTSHLKITPAQFTIERRAEIPFAEDTYFSVAPLRTGVHIGIVNEIEAALT